MSLHEVDLPANAIDVAVMVEESPSPTFLLGVLHHRTVSVYSWSISAMVSEAPQLLHEVPVPKDPGCEFCMEFQISATSDKEFAVLRHAMGTSNQCLVAPESSHHRERTNTLNVGNFIEGIVTCGPGNPDNILITSRLEKAPKMGGSDVQEAAEVALERRLDQVVKYLVSSSRVEAVSWASVQPKPTHLSLVTEPSLRNETFIFS